MLPDDVRSWDSDLYESIYLGWCLRELRSACIPTVLSLVDETWFSTANHRSIYGAILSLALEASGRIGAVLSPEKVAQLAARDSLESDAWAQQTVDSCLAADDRCMFDLATLQAACIDPWRIVRGRPVVQRVIGEIDRILSLSAMGRGSAAAIETLLTEATTAWSNAVHQLDPHAPLTETAFVDSVLAPVEDSKPHFVPTGLAALDGFMLGGIATDASTITGRLITIAARPGIGKTAVLTALAYGAACADSDVAIFTLEVPAAQFYARLYCVHDYRQQMITQGHLIDPLRPDVFARRGFTPAQRERITSYRGTVTPHTYIRDDVLGLEQITSQIRLLKRQRPHLRLACIDHLGLIGLPKADTQTLAIGAATRSLKLLANELQIDIALACQLNRSLESRNDKRPTLSDLRDSGRIEEDSDMVIGLYREMQGEKPEEMSVIAMKNRHGPIGTGILRFHLAYGVVTSA